VSGGRLCLGLHITKCAGTSLITNLRRRLSEDEYYFCSSYHENWLAGRPLFAQVRAPERLRIVFGHYVHQDLLSVFADRELFLFTGLRDPVARAISDYRQLNAIRAWAGEAPVEGGEYIAGHAGAVCSEILRAFPATEGTEPWRQAKAALEMFDYIYDADAFDTQARVIFEVLDVPAETLASDNVSDRKTLPPAFDRVIQRGCDLIQRNTGFLKQDLALWAWAQPRLGRITPTAPRPNETSPDNAKATFSARETAYLVHEFSALGRLAALREGTEGWAKTARAVLERVAEYGF